MAEQKRVCGKKVKNTGGTKAQLLYKKCTCIYCNSTLGCKSSLNRHFVSCPSLKNLLENSPQSVSETDVEIRNKQLELLQRIKDGKKKTLCSFCLEVICAKDMQKHLISVHNFPK